MSATSYPIAPILIVDDNPDVLRSFSALLKGQQINNLLLCGEGGGVEGILAGQDIEIVLLDLNMPGMGGEKVLEMLALRWPGIPVVVVTGMDEAGSAVRCMKHGAFDYLVKPVSEDSLVAVVRRAIEVREMRRENAALRQHVLSDQLAHPDAFADMVTASRSMRDVFRYMEAIAVTSQPALITGETGVGKELAARALHRLSGRAGRFVAVNIAGVDDNVFADTLFGHVRGAFTGADGIRKGLVEQAKGGTLFLDEIGELSNASQIKLLRLLQEREFFAGGSDEMRHSTARVVVATNRDLKQRVEEGRFREDLYYRLRLHCMEIPPLRKRPEDIPLLLQHFTRKAAAELGRDAPEIAPEVTILLRSYSFPGNVREMESLVFEAVSHATSGRLSASAFPTVIGAESRGQSLLADVSSAAHMGGILTDLDPLPTIKDAQGALIAEALRRTGDNQTVSAAILGISRQTLNRLVGKRRRTPL
jgi:DNA-binding NtrC family response regulator